MLAASETNDAYGIRFEYRVVHIFNTFDCIQQSQLPMLAKNFIGICFSYHKFSQ